MTARKSTTKGSSMTGEQAREAIVAHVLTLPTQAAIADALGVNGKTLRQRTRSGGYKDGEGNALPSVRVSKDGTASLTDAHKRAIALAYAPQDDAQAIRLAQSFDRA